MTNTRWVKWSKHELRGSGKCSLSSLQEDTVRLKQGAFNHCSERREKAVPQELGRPGRNTHVHTCDDYIHSLW